MPQKMETIFYLLVFVVFIALVYSLGMTTIDKYDHRWVGEMPNDEETSDKQYPRWTYTCIKERCERIKLDKNYGIVTLETCNMLCGSPSLWPKPKILTLNNKQSSLMSKNQISVKLESPKEVRDSLTQAIDIFLKNIPETTNLRINEGSIQNISLYINVSGSEIKPRFSTNESYHLTVKKNENLVLVTIVAPTYFGARNGLETFSQLIWLDTSIHKLRILHDVVIEDNPVFPHRGLMIDTARNYYPINHLKRVLDGMATTKLNVFHLHLTDAESFPIVLPKNPQFAESGAYSPDMIFTPEDIKGLIEYARIRGIRVILEIDSPTHVSAGWHFNDTNGEKLVICDETDVIHGHLNPDNPNIPRVLQSIYEDLFELGTEEENFHIGGDEINMKCFARTKTAALFQNQNSLWLNITDGILEAVKLANHNRMPKHLILWSSPQASALGNMLKYRENLVIQYWLGEYENLLKQGLKIIFSTVSSLYLDCGFGIWKPSMYNGLCDPYIPWQKFYKYSPWNNHKNYIDQILGGEACLWSEQVDVDTLETRIWPRAAAMAERLWSDPSDDLDYDVYTRLSSHRDRIRQMGIKAAAMWPRWCTQNPGKC